MDFTWKGVSASSMGVCVTELPPVQTPLKRDEPYVIPYRDGQLHIQDGSRDEMVKRVAGYLPYEQGATVETLRTIMNWLQGRGRVSFSDDPGREYEAYITAGVNYAQWVTAFDDRVFEVYFVCEPAAYHTGVSDITLDTSGTTVTNPGQATSRPLWAVTGEGDITLEIGSEAVDLEDIDGTVYLDSEDMEAWSIDSLTDERVNQNGIMTGEFPTLPPGGTVISWTGDVDSVVITPRWRD